MRTLRTTFLALFVVVALLAVACGDSEEDTVVEPTPEPTVAPTPIPTPVPPTPVPPTAVPAAADTMTDTPAVEPGSMTFDVPDLPPDVTGQQVVDSLFSEEEQSCLKGALGEDAYEMLLQMSVLDPAAQGATAVFGECLTQENSVLLFLAGMSGATGGAISDETLNCIGNTVAPNHSVLFAEDLDPTVMFSFLPCLQPDEMAALASFAPQ